MEIVGETGTAPARGLPRDLGRAVAAQREAISEGVMAAVMPALPAFGDPGELPFASGLQQAIESALEELADQIATGKPTAQREIDYRLGRGQSLAMRPLEELLTAYRIGGRAFTHEVAGVSEELGYGPDVSLRVADAVTALIDGYSIRAAAGYADGQLASTGASEMGRFHLVRRMILRSEDRDGWATIARGVGWRIPVAIACVAVRVTEWEAAGALPGGPLAGPIDELICVVVSDPVDGWAAGGAAGADRGRAAGGAAGELLEGLASLPLAVVGPTVPPEEAPHSFARAATLIRAGSAAPGDGLIRADERLHELALLGVEPRVAADFAARRLAPIDALGGRAAGKVGETLRAWLSHQGRYEPTAAEIGVHPQTVRYRINQAREAFGVDFDDPRKRDEIRFALQLRASGPESARR